MENKKEVVIAVRVPEDLTVFSVEKIELIGDGSRKWTFFKSSGAIRILETPPQPAAQDETGWLIENGSNFADLRYRFMDNDAGGGIGWTPDHAKALRFARSEDAEQFCHHDEDAWRVVEHMWCKSPSERATPHGAGEAVARHPTLPECEAAGRGPRIQPGGKFSEGGLPNTPDERARFEAYMRGHYWSVGTYDESISEYDTAEVRRLYGVWRDRGALQFSAPQPDSPEQKG